MCNKLVKKLHLSRAPSMQRKSNFFIYTRLSFELYGLLLFNSLIFADLLFYKKNDTFTDE